MENEEIMMNETSTEEMVSQQDSAIVNTESNVDENSESYSRAAAVAIGTTVAMAVVGVVHVTKTYLVPAAAKGFNFVVSKFNKGKVVEAESTETTDEEAEDSVTE